MTIISRLMSVSITDKKIYTRSGAGVWEEFASQPDFASNASGLVVGLPGGGLICSRYSGVWQYCHYDPATQTWSYRNAPANNPAHRGIALSDGSVLTISGGDGKVHLWNGAAWSILSASQPSLGSNFHRSLWASSVSNVWVVSRINSGQVLHFDGSSWTDHYSALCSALGLIGVRTTDVIGFGADVYVACAWDDSDANTGCIAHWNGSTWSRLGARLGHQAMWLWGTSGSDLWSVGDDYIYAVQFKISHWNGSAWTQQLDMGVWRNYSDTEPRIIVGADASLLCCLADDPRDSHPHVRETVDGATWTEATWPTTHKSTGVGVRSYSTTEVGGGALTEWFYDVAAPEFLATPVPEELPTAPITSVTARRRRNIITTPASPAPDPEAPYGGALTEIFA